MHEHAPKLMFRVAICALAAASGTAHASGSSGWDWMIAPYGWAASVGTDIQRTTPPSSISTDTDFDDIVDKIDGAFEIHVEGEGDDFGVFIDFTYLGLADEHDRRLFHIESDIDARLIDAAVVWSPGETRGRGGQLLGGVRIVDVDLGVAWIPTLPAFPASSIDHGETLTDFMLGGRYTWGLSDRWALTLRGDASWGDTDGTWNLSAVTQYRTRNGAWLFGYRYLDVDLESGGDDISISMHGPLIGYGFRF